MTKETYALPLPILDQKKSHQETQRLLSERSDINLEAGPGMPRPGDASVQWPWNVTAGLKSQHIDRT